MLKGIVEKLASSIASDGLIFQAREIRPGRFREEVDFNLCMKENEYETEILSVKLFEGRRPHYRAWVELFNINNHLEHGHSTIEYFDSRAEERILKFFAECLEPGEKIFVEYINDYETASALHAGFPEVLTRLGYLLYNLGFTWFKDWYFPEGYMEGNQKLQAEKPLNSEARLRHITHMKSEVAVFLAQKAHLDIDPQFTRARTRAKDVLKDSEYSKLISPGVV